MADTIRTLAALQALLADNSSNDISPQDLRDAIYSLHNAYQVMGAADGWKDLKTDLLATPGGGTAPTLTAFGPSGNLKALAFTNGDEVFFTFHTPHDIKAGSTMYPHVHWTTSGTSTAVVNWQLDYSLAIGHNQVGGDFPAPSTINLAEAASGTAWRHMVTEDGTGITAPEPDSLIVCRLVRSSATNGDTVFGMNVDWHYQTDRHATKNRTPDFNA